MLEDIRDKIIHINRVVIYIQRRIKNRIKAKNAKKEIFRMKWTRTLFKLNIAACNKNNDPELNAKIKDFTRHITLIP